MIERKNNAIWQNSGKVPFFPAFVYISGNKSG